MHLLHDFCPACFRASERPNSFCEITNKDLRIDKVQMFYAVEITNSGSLPLWRIVQQICRDVSHQLLGKQNKYDFEKNICSHSNGKVCGTPVIFNENEDFKLLAASIDDKDQLKSKSVVNQIAIRNGAKITSRWKHPIHARLA